MPGVTTAYQNGIHSARPAASAGCILYACSTHSLIYRSDGSAWTTWMTIGSSTTTVASDAIFDAKGDLAVGTGADTAAKLTVGTNGLVLVAASGETTGLKWDYPALTVADAAVGANVSIGGSAYVDIVSLALGAGTWDVTAVAVVSLGVTGQVYAAITDNSNNQLAQAAANIAASREESIPILTPGVAGSQTIKMRVFATQTGSVEGTTAIGSPGGGSKIHALRVA